MKKSIRQYCAVVDRMQPDPACRQAVLEKARRSGITFSRRGLITGSVAAAALLALNVGVGSFLLRQSAADSLNASENENIIFSMTDAPADAAVTTAAECSATQKQTAEADAGKRTAARNDIRKTTETTAQELSEQTAPAETASEPAKQESPALCVALVPTDRPYESTGENKNAPLVCHAKPSEKIRVDLTLRNNPGLSDYHFTYDMSRFDVLDFSSPDCMAFGVNPGDETEPEWDMSFGKDSFSSKQIIEGDVLTSFTLLAPTKPGHYVIQERYEERAFLSVAGAAGSETVIPVCNDPAAAGQQSPVCCALSGMEIIVDEEDYASFGEPEWLFEPKTDNGMLICVEPTVAHAGQKQVPVNILVKNCDAFERGNFSIIYDPALKPLVREVLPPDPYLGHDDDRIGLETAGTLLEHAPFAAASLSYRGLEVYFDNYKKITRNQTVYSDETDSVICEDGVLLTVYFDMPEECGRYRLYADSAIFDGYSYECERQNLRENHFLTEIVVVP